MLQKRLSSFIILLFILGAITPLVQAGGNLGVWTDEIGLVELYFEDEQLFLFFNLELWEQLYDIDGYAENFFDPPEFSAGPFPIYGLEGTIKDVCIHTNADFNWATQGFLAEVAPLVFILMNDGSVQWLSADLAETAGYTQGWGDDFNVLGTIPFLPKIESIFINEKQDEPGVSTIFALDDNGFLYNLCYPMNAIYLTDGYWDTVLVPDDEWPIHGHWRFYEDGTLSFDVGYVDDFLSMVAYSEMWFGSYSLILAEGQPYPPGTLLVDLSLSYRDPSEQDGLEVTESSGVYRLGFPFLWLLELQLLEGLFPYGGGKESYELFVVFDTEEEWGNDDYSLYSLDFSDLEAVRKFLVEGNDANVRASGGETPLVLSILGEASLEVLEELLAAGADVNASDYNDNSPLIWAAWMGAPVEIIEFLLNAGANVNARDDVGATPLMWSLVHPNDLENFWVLLEAEADLYATDFYGDNLLMWAVRHGVESEVITEFIAALDVNAVNHSGKNALAIAAETDADIDVITLLLVAGADPNLPDETNVTPFMRFLWEPLDLFLLEWLISYGADVNLPDDWGNTPLIWATWAQQDSMVVEMLIKEGAEVNCVDGESYTPLMWALVNNSPLETIKILLDAGADPNLITLEGEPPIFIALWNEREARVIIALLESGADPNVFDEYGNSPLASAILYDYGLDVLNAFLQAGADSHLSSSQDETPLMYATINYSGDQVQIVQTLIDLGLNVGKRDYNGQTALHWAVGYNSDLEITMLLLDAGAKVDTRDVNGITPLMIAAMNSTNPKIIKALLDAGADGSLKSLENKTAFDYAQENDYLRGTDEYWDLSDSRFE